MQVSRQIAASNNFDAALCLASIASIKAEQRSTQKIKAKKDPSASVTLPVVGNVDIEKEVELWGLPFFGYNSRQEFFVSVDMPIWLQDIADGTRSLEHYQYPLDVAGATPQRPASPLLQGKTVVISSGPTVEKVTVTGDIITNSSSGRQGRDLAYAFAHQGAKVIYVSGPTYLPPPSHPLINAVSCSSARSMLAECERHLPADIFVGVAAVADFGRTVPEELKLAQGQRHDLYFEQNPDILESMGKHSTHRPQLVIGFAAETDADNILTYAAGKLAKKNADMICANLVGKAIAERGSSNNQITLVMPNDKIINFDVMSKEIAANTIVQAACNLLITDNGLNARFLPKAEYV